MIVPVDPVHVAAAAALIDRWVDRGLVPEISRAGIQQDLEGYMVGVMDGVEKHYLEQDALALARARVETPN